MIGMARGPVSAPKAVPETPPFVCRTASLVTALARLRRTGARVAWQRTEPDMGRWRTNACSQPAPVALAQQNIQ